MMSKVMFIVILGACLWATGESFTNVYDSLSRQVTRIEDQEPGACNVTGAFCSSCTSVSECIDLGNGDYFRQDGIATCDGASSCSNNTGSCTTAPNPDCDASIKGFIMECRQIGVFPHPFNSTKYFMCSLDESEPPKKVALPFTCPDGYAYDVYSTLCRVKLAPKTYGDLLIPPCNGFVRGAIPNHPSMYYICLKKATDTVFSPQLFLCGNNQFYNNATKTCQERSSTLSADGKCTTKVLYYDSGACGAYSECNNGSLPIKRSCYSGYYFDEKKAACTPYTCLNVKN